MGSSASTKTDSPLRARDLLPLELQFEDDFYTSRDAFGVVQKKAEEALRPLRAILELTFHCNFGCVHCYNPRPEGGYHETEWTTEDILHLMDRLADMGVLFLTISGGEAMVMKDYFRILEYARAKRFALRIFTNASLVDEAAADRIAALAPLSVDISIYGSTDETYYAITQRHGMLEATLRGIRLLRERGVTVIVKTPVLKENRHELDAIHALALGMGCQHVMDGKIIPRDGGSLEPYQHMVDMGGQEWDEWALLRQNGCGGSKPGTPRRASEHVCDVAKRGITITPQGDVFPCIRFRKSAGNIFNEDIEQIWKHSRLVNALRELRMGQLPECFTCKFQPWCRPCPADAFYETGRYNAPPRSACRYMEALYDADLLVGLEPEPDGSRPIPNGLRDLYKLAGEARGESPLNYSASAGVREAAPVKVFPNTMPPAKRAQAARPSARRREAARNHTQEPQEQQEQPHEQEVSP